MMKYFQSLLDYIYAGSKYVVFLFLIGMVLAIFFQVVFRYALNSPLTWSEELSRIFFVWMCLIGSSMASRRVEHMSIDVFVKRIPQRGRFVFEVFNFGLVAVLIIYVIIYGIQLVIATKNQISYGANIPVSFLYLSVPVGFGLMFLYMVERMIIRFSKR